ncbi:cupin domain-containing protein [Robiginitalea sp. IMCC44478]|uniref:cupin domain-containing protein n=1 Tax=Robiginitalea sp. IMCC44478 TaxID=3459122 RepID=UPI00404162C8
MMKTNRKSKSTHVFALFGLMLSSLLLCCPTYGQSEIGVMEFPEGAVQHTVYANDIQWNPCPGNLPEGCNIAVLEGSPQQPDLFTVRFKMDGSFYMPPHRHPKDERVTILEGKAYVAFGEAGTRENAKGFGPGDYYVNKREAIHQVWADQGTILQITGIGPWEVHFLDE